MRIRNLHFAVSVMAVSLAAGSSPANAQATSPTQGPVKITLDDAIQMALAHNHTLAAARTTIDQSEAQETTANLRPNPVLLGDAQFLPLFHPDQVDADYLNNAAQFDLGVSYLFERGKKRQHRLAAAKDQTAVTRSTGGGQRAQPGVPGGHAVHQRAARGIGARSGAAGPEEFSEYGGHQQGALPSGRHQRRRLPEDQAAAAAVPERRFAGAARARAGAFGPAAIARPRIRAARLRRGGRVRLPAAQREDGGPAS